MRDCRVDDAGFLSAKRPPLDTHIVVTYRGAGRAVAQVKNAAAIDALKNGVDDGVRSVVRSLEAPSARTQVDCENAALAMLGDAGSPAWMGTYETWSDFLPEELMTFFLATASRWTCHRSMPTLQRS